MANRTNVPDIAALTDAVGKASPTGASLEESLKAVELAAKLNPNTPQKIGDSAAAALNLNRSTGLDDPEANMALAISTGSFLG